MEENIKNENKNNQQHIARKVLGIFATVVVLTCGCVFIFSYSLVYDNYAGAGWVPPSFTVIARYFLVAIVSIFAAIFLKIALQKRVRIWTLLLSAILLPILCYQFNYYAFKKDAFLYPLVDEGGIFHFIVIGDYNFDGMNDELYHIRFDERKHSTRYGGHFDDTIIDYINTNAVGTGSGLSGCHCFYDWEERVIQLFLDEDSVELKQVEILVAFQEPYIAHNVSFYLDDSKLNHTVNKNNTVSIVFDTDTCLKLQKRLVGEERYIPIEYIVN